MTGKRSRGWLAPVLFALTAVWPVASSAQAPAIDPDAVALLRKSTDFVGALKKFRVDTESSIEAVMDNGQKLQFIHSVNLTVQRPNRLRAQRAGEIIDQIFFYDGKALSVYMPEKKLYATSPAPGTLEEALVFARDKLGVIAPASDLLAKNSFELLTEGLTDAYFVGEAVIAGVRCEHLAFRNAEVDWQIFIEEGAQPLPRKFVITSKKMPQSPEFSVVMKKWDLAPKITDAMFTFTPPKDSRRIDFLTPVAKK